MWGLITAFGALLAGSGLVALTWSIDLIGTDRGVTFAVTGAVLLGSGAVTLALGWAARLLQALLAQAVALRADLATAGVAPRATPLRDAQPIAPADLVAPAHAAATKPTATAPSVVPPVTGDVAEAVTPEHDAATTSPPQGAKGDDGSAQGKPGVVVDASRAPRGGPSAPPVQDAVRPPARAAATADPRAAAIARKQAPTKAAADVRAATPGAAAQAYGMTAQATGRAPNGAKTTQAETLTPAKPKAPEPKLSTPARAGGHDGGAQGPVVDATTIDAAATQAPKTAPTTAPAPSKSPTPAERDGRPLGDASSATTGTDDSVPGFAATIAAEAEQAVAAALAAGVATGAAAANAEAAPEPAAKRQVRAPSPRPEAGAGGVAADAPPRPAQKVSLADRLRAAATGAAGAVAGSSAEAAQGRQIETAPAEAALASAPSAVDARVDGLSDQGPAGVATSQGESPGTTRLAESNADEADDASRAAPAAADARVDRSVDETERTAADRGAETPQPTRAAADARGEAATPAEPATPAPRLVGRYRAAGVDYALFSDGSIEAEDGGEIRRFASLAALKTFIETR